MIKALFFLGVFGFGTVGWAGEGRRGELGAALIKTNSHLESVGVAVVSKEKAPKQIILSLKVKGQAGKSIDTSLTLQCSPENELRVENRIEQDAKVFLIGGREKLFPSNKKRDEWRSDVSEDFQDLVRASSWKDFSPEHATDVKEKSGVSIYLFQSPTSEKSQFTERYEVSSEHFLFGFSTKGNSAVFEDLVKEVTAEVGAETPIEQTNVYEITKSHLKRHLIVLGRD